MSRTTNGWHNRLFEIKFGYITNLEYPDYVTLVTLLSALRKEGNKVKIKTLFMACHREGGQAQQCPGESTMQLSLAAAIK